MLKQDGKHIIGYRQAMNLSEQPKDMVIVGSGAIGIEFAYFYNSMGTNVTVVEYLDRIVPIEDIEISKELEKSLKKKGIKIQQLENLLKDKQTSKTFKSKYGDPDEVYPISRIKSNIEKLTNRLKNIQDGKKF